MYSTSAAYKTAIASKLQQSRIVITILTVANETITVTDNKLVPRSVVLSNKASKNNNFTFGSAYVGKFDFTMLNVDDSVDRYSLYGARVTPVYYQKTGENTEESIPLGVFFISEAKRAKKTIAVTCYDAMTKFDFPQSVDVSGKPYSLLNLMCQNCGVTFGMTQGQVEAMPNGTEYFTISAERVSSCRDAIAYLATVLCGFATINRSGDLEIRQYATTSDATIGKNRRTLSTIADYQTYFLGIKTRCINNGKWVKASVNATGHSSGLVVDLGDLPIVQGSNEVIARILQVIADALADYEFTPVDVSITGDASIDLGDMLTHSDVNNTYDSVSAPVTSIVWKYHNVMRILSEGGNATVNAVTDYTSKQVATLEVDSTVDEYGIKYFTNAEEVSLSSTDKVIAYVVYSVYKDTTTAFVCTIPCEVTLDGNIVLTVLVNAETIDVFTTYLERGKHVVTISDYIANTGNTRNMLTIRGHLEYTESDQRRQDAKIGGLIDFTESGEYAEREIDTTIPTGTIIENKVRAMLFASGVVQGDGWSGEFILFDDASAIEIPSEITVDSATDSVEMQFITRLLFEIEDDANVLSIASATLVDEITDTATVVGRVTNAQRVTENSDERVTESGDYRYTESEA